MKPMGTAGIGVDSFGGAVVDPSVNVALLNEASSKRQDDLRDSFEKLMRTEMDSIKRAMDLHAKADDERHAASEKAAELRASHQKELDQKEAGRLDSMRDRDQIAAKTEVDRQAANMTALAVQQATTAETLRVQVASTAQAAEARRSADVAESNKRLSALELALSANAGKQTVEDPRMERLAALVENLSRGSATGVGKSEGISAAMAAIVTAIGVAATLLMIYSFTQRPAAAVYAPAPSTTVPAQR